MKYKKYLSKRKKNTILELMILAQEFMITPTLMFHECKYCNSISLIWGNFLVGVRILKKINPNYKS